MVAYLLTWNPNDYKWDGSVAQDATRNFPSRSELAAKVQADGVALDRWSTGKRKNTLKGSRFFLMRLGVKPHGLVGAGTIVSDHFTAPHWDGTPSKTANYAMVEFDSITEDGPNEAMYVDDIPGLNWHPQAGGILIPPTTLEEAEQRWRAFRTVRKETDFQSPDEIDSSDLYPEGAVRQISVNVFERNQVARGECIRHYGTRCKVCGFDFAAVYGTLGKTCCQFAPIAMPCCIVLDRR
jgi:hypothetical protein